MADLHCEACGATWRTLPVEDATGQGVIADAVRRGEVIQAIKVLRAWTGHSLADARAITSHVSRPRGSCRRCGVSLDGEPTTVCAICSAINLDW